MMYFHINYTPQGFLLTTKSLLKSNTWFHLLADYDVTTGMCRLFVDGELVEFGSSDVTLGSYWMKGMKVGRYFSGDLDYRLDGYLDEFRVFGCLLSLRSVREIAKACGVYGCMQKRKIT